MVQVKKTETRQAILDAAFKLFSDVGYLSATIAQIARKAEVSTSNFYSYFDSKLEVFYELYEPWLKDRLLRLEEQLHAMTDSKEMLESLLRALWCDIPRENGGFAVNLIQAIATGDPSTGYRPGLLRWIEQRVASILTDCLPPEKRNYLAQTSTAHVLMMAFDGFVIGRHLHPRTRFDDGVVTQFAAILLADSAPSGTEFQSESRSPKQNHVRY